MRSDDEVREEGATEGVAIGARGLFPPLLQILQVAVDLDLPSSIHPNHCSWSFYHSRVLCRFCQTHELRYVWYETKGQNKYTLNKKAKHSIGRGRGRRGNEVIVDFLREMGGK